MGREIRRVPPNWQHPLDERGRLQPMYDRTFADAAEEWKLEFEKWEAGECHCSADGTKLEVWEWIGNPPDRKYYRPFSDEEATWYQLWETVTEGTSVSPPFATLEELAAHLAKFGDDWDLKRGTGGWGMAVATRFVQTGWAPTLTIGTSKDGERVFTEAKDIPLACNSTAYNSTPTPEKETA